MSRSPHSEQAHGSGLCGSVVAPHALTAADRDAMYALLGRYFVLPGREHFERDLNEKDLVIVLRDAEANAIKGFSTLLRMELSLGRQKILAFFSGDTIVAAEYWGESLLSRLWSQTVFAEAKRARLACPDLDVFWFLICSGYKTFRFLPVFFTEFYPHPEHATPPAMQHLIDALSEARFGSRYDPQSGIVRLDAASPLRHGVADLTPRRLEDPMVRFFAQRNPGHSAGEELVCITRIATRNLTRAGARIIAAGAPR